MAIGHEANHDVPASPRGHPQPPHLSDNYNERIMRTLGKLLQVAGLVVLPFAMMMQLTAGVRAPTGGGFTVSAMLLITVLGVGLFSIGRIIEGYGSRLGQ